MTKEKTLSEQICELCGMKPRYKYIVKGQSTELTVDKDWLIWKFKNRKSKSVFKVIKAIKTYPDFENPENFVKLIELEIRLPWYKEPSILAHFLNYYCFNLGSRKDFLNDVMDFITDKDECYPVEEINIIKQAIRDYDGWVWG